MTSASCWEGDLLSRSQLSEKLRGVIATLKHGGVFGIDAPFGQGKTFFLEGLARELKADGYHVVYFDAWKADLAQHPLFLFVTEIVAALDAQGICAEAKIEVGEKLGRLVAAVARVGAKSVLRAGDEDLDALLAPLVDEIERLDFTKAGAAAKALSLADDAKKARAAFTDVVNTLIVEPEAKLPLVVLIDELDRARPDFAIEFIEALKMIFDTNSVVFCVAVDRTNLAHTIRAQFGIGYDVGNYLARIFRFWVRLSNPPRNEEFLRLALRNQNLINDQMLEEGGDLDGGLEAVVHTAVLGLGTRASNLRMLEHCAARIALCLRAGGRPSALVSFMAALSLSDPHLLDQYGRGEQAVVDEDFWTKVKLATRDAPEWLIAMLVTDTVSRRNLESDLRGIASVWSTSYADQVRGWWHGKSSYLEASTAHYLLKKIGWALG